MVRNRRLARLRPKSYFVLRSVVNGRFAVRAARFPWPRSVCAGWGVDSITGGGYDPLAESDSDRSRPAIHSGLAQR